MPNTIRSEAELLEMFANNSRGNISAQDMRDFIVSTRVDGREAYDPDLVLASDSDGLIVASSVAISYLEGITSNVQDQIDNMSFSVDGAASTIIDDDLTASRAVISNGLGKIAVSSVTSTELGYLSGVTSAIQTQIDNGVLISPAASTRNIIQPTGAAIIPFVIKGASSQSANLVEWRNSSNTVLSSVSSVGLITAPRFVSTQTTGTAPFGVTSTTVVTNLNADLLDGIDSLGFIRTAPTAAQGIIPTTDTVALSIRRINGAQSSNLLEFRTWTATLLSYFTIQGNFFGGRVSLTHNSTLYGSGSVLRLNNSNNQWGIGDYLVQYIDVSATDLGGVRGGGTYYIYNLHGEDPAIEIKNSIGGNAFLECYNSSDTLLLCISANGAIGSNDSYGYSITSDSDNCQIWKATRGHAAIAPSLGVLSTTQNATNNALVIKANLDFPSGIDLYNGTDNSDVFINIPANAGYGIKVETTVSSTPVFVVKGAASQSANLQEWKNSSDTVLASLSASGTVSAASLETTGSLILKRFISTNVSPSTITSTQNNYNPTATLNIRISSDAARTITGLVAGTDGEHRYITNVGSFNIALTHEDSNSTAANRFTTNTGSGVYLYPDDTFELIYDGTTSRWRVIADIDEVNVGTTTIKQNNSALTGTQRVLVCESDAKLGYVTPIPGVVTYDAADIVSFEFTNGILTDITLTAPTSGPFAGSTWSDGVENAVSSIWYLEVPKSYDSCTATLTLDGQTSGPISCDADTTALQAVLGTSSWPSTTHNYDGSYLPQVYDGDSPPGGLPASAGNWVWYMRFDSSTGFNTWLDPGHSNTDFA